ncbi:lantibiotic dehydratase C-terminal domain-containing protein [Frigoribacterium sp. 2-23]|uniref:lantibiotic dehydratase C-terminal domain-containing protein n=1 Tax=Frigoribacterium sp. 2-23 TaxID=3415006 RepID=UPI003C6EF966
MTAHEARAGERADRRPPEVWSYVSAYPERADDLDLDRVLREWLVPLAARWEPRGERWFFLRFVDEHGPHVRFRLLSDPDVADALHHELFVARRRPLVGRGASSRTSMLGAVSSSTDGGGTVRLIGGLYEPETGKWGSGAPLAAAERAFSSSSAPVLAAVADRGLDEEARVRIAATAQLAVVRAWSPPADVIRAFAHAHRDWWAGPATVQDAARPSAARLREIVEEVVDATDGNAWTPYAEHVVAGPHAPGRPLAYYLHHHLHLTANRLGLTPFQESTLAGALGDLAPAAARPERERGHLA